MRVSNTRRQQLTEKSMEHLESKNPNDSWFVRFVSTRLDILVNALGTQRIDAMRVLPSNGALDEFTLRIHVMISFEWCTRMNKRNWVYKLVYKLKGNTLIIGGTTNNTNMSMPRNNTYNRRHIEQIWSIESSYEHFVWALWILQNNSCAFVCVSARATR